MSDKDETVCEWCGLKETVCEDRRNGTICPEYDDERFLKPAPGSWADVARMMAAISSDDDGVDWDAWKDEMKETNGQGY